MRIGFRQKILRYLNREEPLRDFPLCDFERLRYEIRPGDVLLVEGRTRVSETIKLLTRSAWSHAALYIGRLYDIEDADTRKRIRSVFSGEEDTQLLIESVLGEGTIITPLSRYREDHLRICRPKGIAHKDVQNIIKFTGERLGYEYDVRQIVDLLRLLIPMSIFPRRWFSTLFNRQSEASQKQICSTLIANAFASVQFPILPWIHHDTKSGDIALVPRNTRLYTPSDFDYSPYFEIIKYPIFELSERPMYQKLPWTEAPVMSNDDGEIVSTHGVDADPEIKKILKEKRFSFFKRRGAVDDATD